MHHPQELDRAPASTQLLMDTRAGEVVARVAKLEPSAMATPGVIRYGD